MLPNADLLDVTVVGKITTELLVTCAPTIAVMLTLIIAHRALLAQRIEIAREVSANPNRRGLLLLMLWSVVSPAEPSKSTVEQFIPVDHPSLSWVNSGTIKPAEDVFIADLGDSAICREILNWVNPKEAAS